jgi:hypothetical protein
MSDRELLELAAKAAGMCLEWDGDPRDWQPMYYEGKTYHAWDPLTDYGDALRLAVTMAQKTLGFDLQIWPDRTAVVWDRSNPGARPIVIERNGTDPNDATCRAIVRAAAAMGAGTIIK